MTEITEYKSQIEHFVETIRMATVMVAIYGLTLFRPISNQSAILSWIVLLSMIATSVCVEWFRPRACERNALSKLTAVFLPIELYTAISFWYLLSNMVRTTLLMSVACSIAFAGWLIWLNRRIVLHKTVVASRTICAAFGIVLLLGAFKCNTFGFSSYNFVSDEHDFLLDRNVEQLSDFEGRWGALSVDQKIRLLELVVAIEIEALHVPHSVNITAQSLPLSEAGNYSPRTQTITINTNWLDDGWGACEVVLHEIHHAYSHAVVEVLQKLSEKERQLACFEYYLRYANEYNNYARPTDDAEFYQYYCQAIESDARDFAAEKVIQYQSAVIKYLTEGEKSYGYSEK